MRELLYLRKKDITQAVVEICCELTGQEVGNLAVTQIILPGGKKPHITLAELQMMLLTIAAESSFTDRKQKGGGPARGLMGMEPATALDTFRWLEYKPELWKRLTYIWMGLQTVPFFKPSEEEVSELLEVNDRFALALGRLHYRMFEPEFPDFLANQATYWKQYWNTEGGAGTANHAIKQWHACKCNTLTAYGEKFADLPF